MDDKTLTANPEDGEGLFSEASTSCLVERRNPNLGHVFLAERAPFYLLILVRLLHFRRDHELEPLYEDIYDGVRSGGEAMASGEGYGPDIFRQDMDQLRDWELIECRMEVERLRGYRDSRKRKFRYSLPEDTMALLEWLEDRAQADLEGGEEDTRDVLEEVCSVLKELARLLANHGTKRAREDDPRRALYQLFRLEELTHQAGRRLTEFNARLLGFTIGGYDPAEARVVLAELDEFVHRFLRRVGELRSDIVEGVNKLQQPRNQERLKQCAEVMESERRRVPHLLRRSQNAASLMHMPVALGQFYRDGGRLDQICRRISESAVRVWRKLHAHLRELERRNNRTEDIRERIAEMAALSEDDVPREFMRQLLASGGMTADLNYWDDFVQATPPQPRPTSTKQPSRKPPAIRRKRRRTGSVLSMDEQRLRELRNWALECFGDIPENGTPVSRGAFGSDEDAARILELAKAGLLGNGRRLGRVNLHLSAEDGDSSSVDLQFEQARLRFKEMLLHHGKPSRNTE